MQRGRRLNSFNILQHLKLDAGNPHGLPGRGWKELCKLRSYNKNRRDALISQIYFWNRTLQVSDKFSVHHQESSTVYTAMDIYRTGYVDCLLAGARKQAVSITCMTYTFCCVYNSRTLMMDRGTVRNMQSSIPKINLRNYCISVVLL